MGGSWNASVAFSLSLSLSLNLFDLKTNYFRLLLLRDVSETLTVREPFAKILRPKEYWKS